MPVFQASSADKLIKANNAVGKEYRAKMRGKDGHGFGAVDGFYWTAVVTVLLKSATAGSPPHQAPTSYCSTATPEIVARFLSHFKIYKCHPKPGQIKMSRTEMTASGDVVAAVGFLEGHVKAVGGKRCIGKTLRGFRERELAATVGTT